MEHLLKVKAVLKNNKNNNNNNNKNKIKQNKNKIKPCIKTAEIV